MTLIRVLPANISETQPMNSISSVRQATVGDLVFHQNGSNHVGIYLGNGKVLHASQTAGKVKISTFSSSSRYWDTGCNAAGYCVKH